MGSENHSLLPMYVPFLVCGGVPSSRQLAIWMGRLGKPSLTSTYM